MRLSAVAFLMILATLFLSGCGQDSSASLDDRSHRFYGRNGIHDATGGADGQTFQQAAVDNVAVTNLAAPDGKQYGAKSSPMTARTSRIALPQAAAPSVANGRVSSQGSPFLHSPSVAAPSPPTGESSAQGSPAASIRPAASMQVKNPAAEMARPQATGWQWPVTGRVTQPYGPAGNGVRHEGIVIAAADGAPIRSAQAGQVVFVGSHVPNYGNMVILRHANGDMTSYGYARNITVAKGAAVKAGAVIGYVGKTGGASTPALHFAMREGSHTVDPLGRLPQQVASR